MDKLSVVIAVFNEEYNVEPLIKAVRKALDNKDPDYELVFVDDGSTDGTSSQIIKFSDERTTLIQLRKNFGQTAALKAGIDYVKGEYIATLDGDLQNDPEDLLKMLEILKKDNYDIVAGIRSSRKDHLFLRKLPSSVANFIVRRITGTDIIDNGCAIKIMKADFIKDLPMYGEMHRFLSTLSAMEGARIKQIPVNHLARVHGKSKYGLDRTLKVISDLILMNFRKRFEQKPMYLYGTAGFFTSLAGAIILLSLFIDKLLGKDIWGRPVMLLGVLLLFIGFQIISTGLVLDLIIRKHFEHNQIKPYRIKRIVNGKTNE